MSEQQKAKRPMEDSAESGFLLQYGGLVTLGAFLLSLIANGIATVAFFSSDSIVLGLWALGAIFALPKAVLGFILIMARDTPLAVVGLPMILNSLFPRTVQRYRGDNLVFESVYHRARNGYIRETLWLLFGLLPSSAVVLK